MPGDVCLADPVTLLGNGCGGGGRFGFDPEGGGDGGGLGGFDAKNCIRSAALANMGVV